MLTQADEASTKTDRAGAKEKVGIAVAGSYGEDGFDAKDFKTEIEENLKGKITSGDGEFPIKVTMDGYNFEISDVGIITEKGKGSDPTTPSEDEVIPGKIVEKTNKTYTDKDGDTAIIPVGFAIVPNLNDVSEGLVISDKENDTGDEGNQFVWIPVESAEEYKTNTTYKETDASEKTQNDIGYLPVDDAEIGIKGDTDDEQKRKLTFAKEKEMVTKEGTKGFYISRYEAGDGLAKEKRTGAKDGQLVSKKNTYVYNYISLEEIKEKTKKFKNDEYVKSALCTGVQWDMVMAFISKEEREDGTNQPFDVTVKSDARHKGNSVGVQQTGQNLADKVCNIYDLEGNCMEYVAECESDLYVDGPIVKRGGYYKYFEASRRSR